MDNKERKVVSVSEWVVWVFYDGVDYCERLEYLLARLPTSRLLLDLSQGTRDVASSTMDPRLRDRWETTLEPLCEEIGRRIDKAAP